MNGRIPARACKLAATALIAFAALAVSAGSASATTAVEYNNLPATNPGNVVSESFEANQQAQLGGQIQFAGSNLGSGGSINVGLSSWACEKGAWTGSPECVTAPGGKFAWPITLNINQVGPGNSVGPLIESITKTFNIPYRPSQSNRYCTGSHAGAWWDAVLKTCFHGKYATIAFPLKDNFLWPARAILSVSYNTSDYGAEPQRPKPCDSEPQGCPYDSLNVGLAELETEPAPSVGAYPTPANAYQNTLYAPYYCDGGAGGTGTFRLDEGCWKYQPLFKVKATL
jgi:hypothetical protein